MGGETTRNISFAAIMFMMVIPMILQGGDALSMEVGTEDGTDGPLLPMDPDVWVELEQDSYQMKVEPGDAEPIFISGTVHCETPPGFPPDKEVVVELEILGSQYHIENMYFDFDRTRDAEDFTIEVAPILEHLVDQEILIRFMTIWYMSSPEREGTGGSDQARINPLPYGSLHIQDMEEIVFEVGELHEVELVIENNGNCEARISMSLEVDGNLEVAYPDLLLIIPGRNVGYYPYLIKQESGAGETGKLIVTARSNISGINSVSTLEVNYRTQGKILSSLADPTVFVSIILILTVLITVLILIIRKVKKRRSRPESNA